MSIRCDETSPPPVRTVGSFEPAVRAEPCALFGDPRVSLVDLSRRAHLLVLGSRGRGALRSMLLGSVSAAVVRHAGCPVVVCRPGPPDRRTPGVVVGADGSRESMPVLDFAFRHASLRGLPLTVVHSYWDAVAAVTAETPDLERLRLTVSESVAGFQERYPDVRVTLRLRHGLVDEVLSPRGESCDLIVVGRHPATSMGRLLTGSVAVAVVERAPTNVAVVPEEQAGAG